MSPQAAAERTALFTPTRYELDDARARIGRLAGDSVEGSHLAFALEAAGRPGEIIRALRHGDLEAAARGLRALAALDLAAAERRDALPVAPAAARVWDGVR